MAERRLKNRRLSSRKSNNASGFLNENTNIIDTGDPVWFDRSIVRPSTSINITRTESSVLNSNSTVNVSQYSETWFNNLTRSDVSAIVSNDQNIDKDGSNLMDPSTETESDSQRKRAQFGLNKKYVKKKNHRLKSNVFLQALEKTTDSNLNNLNAEELLDEDQSESTNDESRSIKKIRPTIFKRKNLLKNSESNFDNVFENDKSSTINDLNLSNSKTIITEITKNNVSPAEANSKRSNSKILNESKSLTNTSKSYKKSNVEKDKNSSKNLQRNRSTTTLNKANISTKSVKSKIDEAQDSPKGVQNTKSSINLNESNILTSSAESMAEESRDFPERIQKINSSITLNVSNISNISTKSKVKEDNLEEAQDSPKMIHKNKSGINLNESNISASSVKETQNSSKRNQRSKSKITLKKSNISTKSANSKINEKNLEQALGSPQRILNSRSRINLNESNISTRSAKSKLEEAHDSRKKIQKSSSIILNISNISTKPVQSVITENNLEGAQSSPKGIQKSRSKISLDESNISTRSVKSKANKNNLEQAQDSPKKIQKSKTRINLNESTNSRNPAEPILEEAQNSLTRLQQSKSTLDLNQSNISIRSAKSIAIENHIAEDQLPRANISIVHDANKFTFNTLMNPKVLVEKISIKKLNKSPKNMEKNYMGKISLKKLNTDNSNSNESEKSVETSTDRTVEKELDDELSTNKENVILRKDQNHQVFQSTPKAILNGLRIHRISSISDYLVQTPKPAQSTMNPNGRPLMNITGLSFLSTSAASIGTQNQDKEASIQNHQEEENSGDEQVDVEVNNDDNMHKIPDNADKLVVQSTRKSALDSRFQKTVNKIENFESTITNIMWKNIKKKTDAIKEHTRARMAREVAREKEIKLQKLQSERNLRRILAKQEALRKQIKKKPIDKAYLVNGKPYKRPRLPRPTKWASDRLYKFLWKCMESRYGIRTRIKSEQFIVKLAECEKFITKKKKYNQYEDELQQLLITMAKLNIIKTQFDFHRFCNNFLPYSFRIKVVPMMLPGNKRNIPFHRELLFKPILNKKNYKFVNTSNRKKKYRNDDKTSGSEHSFSGASENEYS